MTRPFRVALSHDFRLADGTPAYRSSDLAPLLDDPRIEMTWLPPGDRIRAEDVAEADALVLLVPRFDAASIPAGGRLALVARFRRGLRHVDVAACSAAGIAVSITPDGVRRPVAQCHHGLHARAREPHLREGPDHAAGAGGLPHAQPLHGEGLVGTDLVLVGLGNIGAEMFRLAAPFGMRHVAHDPAADPVPGARAGRGAGGRWTRCSAGRFRHRELPAAARDARAGGCAANRADEARAPT
jgi:D-3-phosphoglycerate dehydrogenase